MRAWLLCSVLAAGSTVVLPTHAQARDMVHAGNSVAIVQLNPDHHARHRRLFGVLVPFGFFGGLANDERQGLVAAVPPEIAPSSTAPPASEADRPPCHETTPEGVTIDRGLGCKRAAR